MKQIGLGFLQYAQDYDETFPNSLFGGYGWAPRIHPYTKSSQIYTCPDDRLRPDSGYTKVSYGINPFLFNWKKALTSVPLGSVPGLNISNFNSPSLTAMMVESQGTSFPKPNETNLAVDEEAGGCTNYKCSMSAYPQNGAPSNRAVMSIDLNIGTSGYPVDPHDTDLHSLNYLAADGHVKFLPFDRISTGYAKGISTGTFYIGSNYGNGTIEPNKTTAMGDAALTFNYQ